MRGQCLLCTMDDCADFFREPGVSDQVLIALLAVITAAGIIFFIIALMFYHLTTKRFCTCGGMTGPSDVRVSITLISAIALGALLLVILLLAGVAGESSVIASSIAVCVEQVVLLIVFLTSRKIRTKVRKCFERKETATERALPLLVQVNALQ